MDYEQMDEWEQQQHDDGEFLELLEAFLREHHAEIGIEVRDVGRSFMPDYEANLTVSRGDREIFSGSDKLPRH